MKGRSCWTHFFIFDPCLLEPLVKSLEYVDNIGYILPFRMIHIDGFCCHLVLMESFYNTDLLINKALTTKSVDCLIFNLRWY